MHGANVFLMATTLAIKRRNVIAAFLQFLRLEFIFKKLTSTSSGVAKIPYHIVGVRLFHVLVRVNFCTELSLGHGPSIAYPIEKVD